MKPQPKVRRGLLQRFPHPLDRVGYVAAQRPQTEMVVLRPLFQQVRKAAAVKRCVPCADLSDFPQEISEGYLVRVRHFPGVQSFFSRSTRNTWPHFRPSAVDWSGPLGLGQELIFLNSNGRYERNASLIRPRRKGGSLVPKKSRSDAILECYRRAAEARRMADRVTNRLEK